MDMADEPQMFSRLEQHRALGSMLFALLGRSILLNTDAALGRSVLAEISRASGGTTYFPETESEPELTGCLANSLAERLFFLRLFFYRRVHDIFERCAFLA